MISSIDSDKMAAAVSYSKYYLKFNVWSIKIRTTHNLSLWLYEYFWIILLYGHLVYFILKVLAWEIWNMKWGFAKKVIIKSQRQFMDQTLVWAIPKINNTQLHLVGKINIIETWNPFHFICYPLPHTISYQINDTINVFIFTNVQLSQNAAAMAGFISTA